MQVPPSARYDVYLLHPDVPCCTLTHRFRSDMSGKHACGCHMHVCIAWICAFIAATYAQQCAPHIQLLQHFAHGLCGMCVFDACCNV